MSKRNILLLAVAIMIAAFTAVALKSRMAPSKGDTAVKMQRVLVAKKDIPLGGFVRANEDLSWASWPASGIQEYHIKEGAEPLTSFEGAVARRAIKAGEPVTGSTLIKPGAGGFLSAVLEPGKRAFSLAVTATTGNAGFIFPGDRVDVIVTHKVAIIENANTSAEEALISETFIENVRVVAVDQRMDNPENKALLAKTITVEVDPKQAEKIAIASEMGKVSLALRSLSDQTVTPKEQADAVGEDFVTSLESNASFTRDYEVSPALSRSGDTNPRIRVMRGDQSERLEFYRNSH